MIAPQKLVHRLFTFKGHPQMVRAHVDVPLRHDNAAVAESHLERKGVGAGLAVGAEAMTYCLICPECNHQQTFYTLEEREDFFCCQCGATVKVKECACFHCDGSNQCSCLFCCKETVGGLTAGPCGFCLGRIATQAFWALHPDIDPREARWWELVRPEAPAHAFKRVRL